MTLNELGLGVLGGFDGTGCRGPVGGRGRALCLPGHGDGAAVCVGMHEATRRARGRWAAPDGVASWSWLPLAATGGSATAEVAAVGDARRHRHLHPSKRACGALVKEERPCATCQGAQVIDDKALTKNDTDKTLKL